MAIPDSIQVEYTTEVPLQLVRDKDGVSYAVTNVASVPVDQADFSGTGSDIMSVFNEGPGTLWLKICSTVAGRATYGSTPVAPGWKETFLLPARQLGEKNMLSMISRVNTQATVNIYPRGS